MKSVSLVHHDGPEKPSCGERSQRLGSGISESWGFALFGYSEAVQDRGCTSLHLCLDTPHYLPHHPGLASQGSRAGLGGKDSQPHLGFPASD